MTDTLAGRFSSAFITHFAAIVKQRYSSFNTEHFVELVFDGEWEVKPLKQRIRHISLSLGQTLPSDYREAIAILSDISPACTGFEYLFFPDFVEVYGLDDWKTSMQALARFTSSSSAEFAVRPFIERDPKRMMQQMLEWSTDANHHIRRLASEGCRPKLPWAAPLRMFIDDPAPILPILERLKADESEYVRKSVANNLNDIAKNHPEKVLQIAKAWRGQDPRTDWIIKHGCRTLLRKADPEVLALFGLNTAPKVVIKQLQLSSQQIRIGEALNFSFSVCSSDSAPQLLRIEYAIDFVKANGKTSRKLFKITENTFDQTDKVYNRTHSFKDLTTRKHYPGIHQVTIVINGVDQISESFKVMAAT